MSKEPGFPNGGSSPERRSRLSEQAIGYALDIHRYSPDTREKGVGVYRLPTLPTGEACITEFAYYKARQRKGYEVTVRTGAERGADSSLPGIMYSLTYNRIKIDRREFYMHTALRALDEIYGLPNDSGVLTREDVRRERERAEMQEAMLQDVELRIEREHAAGKDILDADGIIDLLTFLKEGLGGEWQSSVAIPAKKGRRVRPSASLIELFKKTVQLHANDKVEKTTEWDQNDQRWKLVTIDEKKTDEHPSVTLLRHASGDPHTLRDGWNFTPFSAEWVPSTSARQPFGDASSMEDPTSQMRGVQDGLAELTYRAEEFKQQSTVPDDGLDDVASEALLPPDREAFEEAWRYAREIHGRDMEGNTIFKSDEFLRASAHPFAIPMTVQFSKVVSRGFDELPQNVHVITVNHEGLGEGKRLPWITYTLYPDGIVLRDYPTLRRLSKKRVENLGTFGPLVEEFIDQERAGKNILNDQETIRVLADLQAEVGDPWSRDVYTIAGIHGAPTPGTRRLFSEIVEAEITTPFEIVQVTKWQGDNVRYRVETVSDEVGNPSKISVGKSTSIETGGIKVVESEFWGYSTSHTPEYLQTTSIESDVDENNPQVGMLRDILVIDKANIGERKAGKFLPASADEKQKGLTLLGESVIYFRDREISLSQDEALMRALFGPDAAVEERPVERDEDGEESGAWTAGSHKTDKSKSTHTPHVEIVGDNAEVHDPNHEERNEPDKGNGRE